MHGKEGSQLGKKAKTTDNRAEIVKKLIDTGKEQGQLTYEEIGDALNEIDLDKEQIEEVYDSLASMGIEVIGDSGEKPAKTDNKDDEKRRRSKS